MQRTPRSRFEAHWIALLRELRGAGNVPLTQAQIELLRREFLLALDQVWNAALGRRRRPFASTPSAAPPLGRPQRDAAPEQRWRPRASSGLVRPAD